MVDRDICTRCGGTGADATLMDSLRRVHDRADDCVAHLRQQLHEAEQQWRAAGLREAAAECEAVGAEPHSNWATARVCRDRILALAPTPGGSEERAPLLVSSALYGARPIPAGHVVCPRCEGEGVTGPDGSACVCAIYGRHPGFEPSGDDPPREVSGG